MNLKKKKKGFTLIELMAVIAIIAILAAVLVPTVSGYINRSKKTAIITQARNTVHAIETYNATALDANVIQDDAEIFTLIGENGVLEKSELLETKDIDRLATTADDDITVEIIKAINSDKDAVNNIVLDKTTGKVSGYDNGLEGDDNIAWGAN